MFVGDVFMSQTRIVKGEQPVESGGLHTRRLCQGSENAIGRRVGISKDKRYRIDAVPGLNIDDFYRAIPSVGRGVSDRVDPCRGSGVECLSRQQELRFTHIFVGDQHGQQRGVGRILNLFAAFPRFESVFMAIAGEEQVYGTRTPW